jgi:hypothetical protein
VLLGLAFLAKKFISKPKAKSTPGADAAVVRKEGGLDNTLEVRTDTTVKVHVNVKGVGPSRPLNSAAPSSCVPCSSTRLPSLREQRLWHAPPSAISLLHICLLPPSLSFGFRPLPLRAVHCTSRGGRKKQNEKPTYICASSQKKVRTHHFFCVCFLGRFSAREVRKHGGTCECISQKFTGEIFLSGGIFFHFFFFRFCCCVG